MPRITARPNFANRSAAFDFAVRSSTRSRGGSVASVGASIQCPSDRIGAVSRASPPLGEDRALALSFQPYKSCDFHWSAVGCCGPFGWTMKCDIEADWIVLRTCNYRCSYCLVPPEMPGEQLHASATRAGQGPPLAYGSSLVHGELIHEGLEVLQGPPSDPNCNSFIRPPTLLARSVA